jgi:hypothetical protein
MSTVDSSPGGSRLLTVAVITAWCFLYFDGLWGYLQHLAFGKKVVPGSVWLLLLLIVGFSGFSFKIGTKAARVALTVVLAWSAWMLLVLIVASQGSFSSPFRIAFGFFTNYWPIFLLVIWMNSAVRVDRKLAALMIACCTVPVLGLGITQGVLQDSLDIGRRIAEDANTNNLGFFGMRRANSIFAHAEDLGFFGAAISAIGVAMVFYSKRASIRLAGFFVFLMAVAATYFTFTRAAYLAASFSTAAALAIVWRERNARMPYLATMPYVFALIAALVFYGAAIVSGLSEGLMSNHSLVDRFYGNNYYFRELEREGWYAYLTGLGWFVGGHHRALFAIDNQYLSLVLSTGLIGLVAWLVTTGLIWRRLVDVRISAPSAPLTLGLIAACSPWLGLAFFNVTNSFVMFALLVVILVGNSRESAPSIH